MDGVLAEIRDYRELITALRQQVIGLNVRWETVGEIAGLPDRYLSKLLAPVPMRGIGRTSLGPLLGTLGCKLVLMRDGHLPARIREAQRNTSYRMRASGKSKRVRFFSEPGVASWAAKRRVLLLGAKRLSRIGRHAARVRWAKAAASAANGAGDRQG
jgi:hypothetical protein